MQLRFMMTSSDLDALDRANLGGRRLAVRSGASRHRDPQHHGVAATAARHCAVAAATLRDACHRRRGSGSTRARAVLWLGCDTTTGDDPPLYSRFTTTALA